MGLETATYIADLVTTNPPTSDLETQGANHLQLIKSVLQNVFGTTVRRTVALPTVVSVSVSTAVTLAQAQTTFLVNTAGGAITMTLPTLGAGDAGWECYFVKTTTDTNPIFIAPPAGTIQSGEYTGLAKTRRCIPGRRTRCFWTGSAFIAERVVSEPVGALVDYSSSKTLPVGYEWPNGQTLSGVAGSNYPEFFALTGGLTTVDMRGRANYGQDDMGGVAANRITVAGGNFDGTVLNNTGGLQNHTMTTGELVAHNHTGSGNVTDPGHTHTAPANRASTVDVGGNSYGGGGVSQGNLGSLTNSATTGITVPSLNINNTGSGNPFTILAPALTCPKLLVVE
jgi:microcystin-dependent protein